MNEDEIQKPGGKIAAALAKAQAAIKMPGLNKRNPHFKSCYAGLDDIIEAVREPLAANGLSYTQVIQGDKMFTFLLHESGERLYGWYQLPDPLRATPQQMGSAITYARRYALSAILGVVGDEDDDGEAGNDAPRGRQEPPKQERRPASTARQEKPATAAQAPVSDMYLGDPAEVGKAAILDGMFHFIESVRTKPALDELMEVNSRALAMLKKAAPGEWQDVIDAANAKAAELEA